MPGPDLLVIGAGPYGLSVAAHARRAGLEVRVVGVPMGRWADAVPPGLRLVSDRRRSSLSDPGRRLTMLAYQPAAAGQPVTGAQLAEYGRWFAREAGIGVDARTVVDLRAAGSGHRVTFDDGTGVEPRCVAVALGLGAFPFVAPVLAGVGAPLAVHSSAVGEAAAYRGLRVAVVGGGQSAVEWATVLAEAGAAVTLLVRHPELRWRPEPLPGRHLLARLRTPHSALGPGWGAAALVWVPGALRVAPYGWRSRLARRSVAPSAGEWLRARLDAGATIRLGARVVQARASGGVVHLELAGGEALEVDRVVSATGYRPDAGRLGWLHAPGRLAMVRGTASPQLSRHFESSQPGLCFTGALAAASFGVAQTSLAGVDAAARRVARTAARRAAASR